MKIKYVKTAIKVGDFILRKNNKNKINIKYLSNISKNVLTDNIARVYLFVVDGIIKKIGGSAAKGGIKATMSFYISAMTGSPGAPRFILHLHIAEELQKANEVELYMITSPKVLAEINGLFGSKKVKIASFKEMEKLCESDYYSIENHYPDWNYQENHEEYPKRLAKQHNIYQKNRLDNKKG